MQLQLDKYQSWLVHRKISPRISMGAGIGLQRPRRSSQGSQFTDVTHVVPAMRRIYLVSRGGADGNTVAWMIGRNGTGQPSVIQRWLENPPCFADVPSTSSSLRGFSDVPAKCLRLQSTIAMEDHHCRNFSDIYTRFYKVNHPYNTWTVFHNYVASDRRWNGLNHVTTVSQHRKRYGFLAKSWPRVGMQTSRWPRHVWSQGQNLAKVPNMLVDMAV